MRSAKALLAFALISTIFCSLLLSSTTLAAEEPMRSGKVVSASDNGTWTLVQADDSEGKMFWVYLGICVISHGGQLDVLEGKRYEKLLSRFDGGEKTLVDTYVATLVRVNGRVVNSSSKHEMPEGCLILR